MIKPGSISRWYWYVCLMVTCLPSFLLLFLPATFPIRNFLPVHPDFENRRFWASGFLILLYPASLIGTRQFRHFLCNRITAQSLPLADEFVEFINRGISGEYL